MEIAGFDNVLNANTPCEAIIDDFESKLKKFWPNLIVDSELISDTYDAEKRQRG